MANPLLDNHVSFPRLIDEARRQGLQDHFSMIEFPLNLFEKDAIRSFDGRSSLIESAKVLRACMKNAHLKRITVFTVSRKDPSCQSLKDEFAD